MTRMCERCGRAPAEVTHVCPPVKSTTPGINWWEGHKRTDSLMRHQFSGDPWGPCALCDHPAHHEIHRLATERAS